jgi:three-Cys-motif partner protein
MASKALKIDEIGPWSEVKLDIVREYASAYSRILAAQKTPSLYHVYVDAFAGAGQHVSKVTGELVAGSPLNALRVTPSFKEYHFIDMNNARVAALEEMAAERPEVHVHQGDCNAVLGESVLPHIKYEKYRRGLCLLDPYGLHLNWDLVERIGKMRSMEIFLNFPIMDMNMNALCHEPEAVKPEQAARMTAFWGDDSWKAAAYTSQPGLFGDVQVKEGNEAIVKAYRKRLKEVAEFKYVPEPMPMRNSNNAVVYYLFFASNNPVAKDIVEAIFQKYGGTNSPGGMGRKR